MPTYDDKFFDYVNSGAITSARKLLPLLTSVLKIDSVLDVGCGQGAWLSVWNELGVTDHVGVDGEWVNPDSLLINRKNFSAFDLSKELALHRNFDVVQSFEVAEHLHDKHADVFVRNLTRHSGVVVFSAAAKGQGGDNHVNEQNYEYWRSKFEAQQYHPFDYLRPQVKGFDDVEAWYRYNMILYVHKDVIDKLSPAIRSTRIHPDAKIVDISPAIYKARKLLVRALPISIMTRVAKIKERWIVRLRRGI